MFHTLIQRAWLAHTRIRGVPLVVEKNYKKTFSINSLLLKINRCGSCPGLDSTNNVKVVLAKISSCCPFNIRNDRFDDCFEYLA
jgi:hypothetical protein